MPEYTLDSSVRLVVDRHPRGAELLWEHGYEVGEGFADVLSQWQTLREAARSGRIRAAEALVDELNEA